MAIRSLQKIEHLLSASPTGGEVALALAAIYHSLSIRRDRLSPSIYDNLALASLRLGELGLADPLPSRQTAPETKDDLIARARAWLQSLPPAGVLEGSSFAVGCGSFLDLLDEAESGPFVDSQAERLLRHVEVKREKSLSRSFPETDSELRLRERFDVAIFFSRFAVRHGDRRFLNTALKMNDGWLTRWKKFNREPRARFLLSLAEQEVAVKRLL